MPIYAWTRGVELEETARVQLQSIANMPFIHHHVAVMPDVHWGMGSTVGSVIPTKGAIIPASVGVDIGCGMLATRLEGVTIENLPDNLSSVRAAIEQKVPVGFGKHKTGTVEIRGQDNEFIKWVRDNHPKLGSRRKNTLEEIVSTQFGTLGGGNHFIELCVDTDDRVWIMLHSGSRGIGNIIGQYFIELAREDMRRHFINLPDKDLAYLIEGTSYFNHYMIAVKWAQDYAMESRNRMAKVVLDTLQDFMPPFHAFWKAVNCHHNYVAIENHFGDNVYLTRKGAVRARAGDMGIIPGSMGDRSYIVRGKGNPDSFQSCSHGAGRVMSRNQAKREISLDDHKQATEGVECRKDNGVIDESPAAYKSIDAVMAAQSDLVEIVTVLKQFVCIKG